MGWDAPWHWVVLAILVIALFGYKKLPDASRSLGRSLRIFKTELKGMTQDDQARENAHEIAPAAAQPPVQQAPVQQAPVELGKPAEQASAATEPPAPQG
ncbi:MAG TPA: Sec-independent protein translocase subunit TatA [Jatrophihabitantaceae bacterium]|nr:Sec-independent protein translocase subunit TatA [Jatrophihabitantaceae bacterium]